MARCVRLVVLLTSVLAASALFAEGVLIQCARPCSKEIAAVKKAGGSITYEYQYVDGIAAEVPSGQIAALEKIVGADRMGKDELIPYPTAVADRFGVIEESVVEAEG